MSTVIAIILAGVLSTAEFCANPIAGGRGEPDWCRLSVSERIDTPYFALVVGSEVLIGVDQNGRRISIQFSTHQNQAGLFIQAIPLEEVSRIRDSVAGVRQYLAGQLSCRPQMLGGIRWERCVPDQWEEKYLSQYYFLQTATDLLYVDHYASALGRQMDAVLARVLDSLVANGV